MLFIATLVTSFIIPLLVGFSSDPYPSSTDAKAPAHTPPATDDDWVDCMQRTFIGHCRAQPVLIKLSACSRARGQETTPQPPAADEGGGDGEAEQASSALSMATPVQHPNILMHLGWCMHEGQVADVWEYPGSYHTVSTLLQLIELNRLHMALPVRLRIARDIALALHWLHRQTPPCTHPHLHASNIHLDDKWRAKIALLGATKDPPPLPSYLVATEERANGAAKGIDQLCFAEILWALALGAGSERRAQEISAWRCTGGLRPELSDELPSRLRLLIGRCWHCDPAGRPSFEEVVEDLSHVLLEVSIGHPHVRHFWAEFFFQEYDVSLYELEDTLVLFLEEDHGLQVTPRTNEVIERAFLLFRRFLATSPTPTEAHRRHIRVTLPQFGDAMAWLGPLLDHRSGDVIFFRDLSRFLGHQWFHGRISASEAQQRLQGRERGTYLVRCSATPGRFTVSCVGARENGTVSIDHLRTKLPLDGGLGRVEQWLEEHAATFGCTIPWDCPSLSSSYTM